MQLELCGKAVSPFHSRRQMTTKEHCLRTCRYLPLFLLGVFLSEVALAQESKLPDSPGAVLAQAAVPAPRFSAQTSAASQALPQQSQSDSIEKPVGTAAAETTTPTGVPVSNAAGAAIAPPKQRRVRTLVIKVAAIAGAGVAIGTVAALSSASPSRPPGSH